jgi:hypothetical protein
MTQDEIMGMAQQCGLIGMRPHLDGIYSEALESFAKLVTAKEREACAKVAENRILAEASKTEKVAYYTACKNIATQIRARGEA